MRLAFSQSDIITTAKSLGLPSGSPSGRRPTDGFIQRRVARAFDLVQSNKVDRIDDDIFRVQSQYEEGKHYIVDVNHGNPSCDCPDNKRTVWCKHQIAARLFAQEKQPRFRIIDDTKHSRNQRGRWVIFDNEERMGYVIYRNKHGAFECACFKKNCIHEKLVKSYLEKSRVAGSRKAGHSKRIVNECGSVEAKKLQDKLNAQLDPVRDIVSNGVDSRKDNGTGACAEERGDEESPSYQLDVSDPFQEAEKMDIEQIEGRRNGDLVHKLSNGEYVISYNGIMHLAEKHGIGFSLDTHEDTHTVIATARLNGSKRISGKPINGSVFTAGELAKRNAARQLLPYPEIKALEKKAQFEHEFTWEKAKATCLGLVPKFKLDIAIHDLVRAGKLEQKHPSDYNRIEWLMIYHECKKDAEINGDDDNNDDGGNTPSSSDNGWRDKLAECQEVAKNFRRYDILKSDLRREDIIPKEQPREWNDSDFTTLKEACEIDASLFGRKVGRWTIELEPNEKIWAWFGRYDFWLTPLRERCFWCEETKDNLGDCCIEWGRYSFKTLLCLDCKPSTEELTDKFDKLYRGIAAPSFRSAELPETEEEFIAECKRLEDEVVDDNPVDANAMPLESGGGKRMLQMDKDKNITLVEADGTSKAMTIKDVAFTFGSDVVMRLTQGIQVVGADISTVELD